MKILLFFVLFYVSSQIEDKEITKKIYKLQYMRAISWNTESDMNDITIEKSNKTVFDSLIEDYNIPIDASCGGKGTCGKCKVRVLQGDVSAPDEEELQFLSAVELCLGYRLACRIIPQSEIHISVEDGISSGQILDGHNGFRGVVKPLISKKYIELDFPTLENQDDDLTRLLKKLDAGKLDLSVSLLQSLPQLLRENDYKVTAVYNNHTLVALEPGDTSAGNYAIACDLGTTTVVAYLLDCSSGEIIDTRSGLNAQKPFGADVIARIEYTMKNPEGLGILQEKMMEQLSSLTKSLLEFNKIPGENFYSLVVAGNTTMLHLLAGINPSAIAAAPFIPAFLKGFTCSPFELGTFYTDCQVYFMPSISAYVGADIVAGVLATSMQDSEDLTLLVDLGTNGEIILGNKGAFHSCSTAAGPAFEGAHISCGMGAVKGAINTFGIGENIEYTVIGDSDPIGICGSAIVDIVATFLEKGIIDETGRFAEVEDLENEAIRKVFINSYDSEGEGRFILVPKEKTATGIAIVFTQRDIREVQLAKAAISAGIATLLHHSEKSEDDVVNLYIAGGFGNYINKESSAKMGLIPSSLLDRSVSVGNSAGLGAIYCSLNADNLRVCESIVSHTAYVELSGSPWFQQKYMEEMVF